MKVKFGDLVAWENSKKPIGTVVKLFLYKGKEFAVVANEKDVLKVVLAYEKLIVWGEQSNGP